MLSELDNPHFFFERAREVHRRAETIQHDGARESLMALANDYLRLAKCAIDRRRYSKRRHSMEVPMSFAYRRRSPLAGVRKG